MPKRRKHRTMPVTLRPVCVSVINMKGGVGKSTIAALLSRHAALTLKLKVLAIDLDPQANLSQAFMPNSYQHFLDSRDPSIVEVFDGYRPPAKSNPSPTPLRVDDFLVDVGHNLNLIPSRFDFSDNLIKSLKPDPQILANCIAEHFLQKDLIIIDCPPTESVLTRAAYHASRYILVPVRPEYFATIGFPLLRQSIESFATENRGHEIEVIGVVINNAFYHGGNDGGPEKERALREIREEAEKNDWHIFNTQIPHSRGFPKKMRGDYSYPGNSTNFDFFATEFFSRLGLYEDP